MTKLPTPQEQVIFRGASFNQRDTGGGGGLPLANALQQFSAQRREQMNRDALARVRNAATQVQSTANLVGNATGVPLLAAVPEGTTGDFAETFENQARSVFTANLTKEAVAVTRQLSREFADDPQGFAEQFNAWMAPQVQVLREQDATLAFEVQQRLDEFGLETMFEIEEEVGARAVLAEQLAFRTDADQLLADESDFLLTGSASETDLAAAQSRLRELWEGGIVSGNVGLDQGFSKIQNGKASLAREFMRGRFQSAADAGDVRGAEGVIEYLRAGGMFDDNEIGRVLVGKLESELKAQLGQAEGTRSQLDSIAMRDLQAWSAAIEAGVAAPAPEEALSRLLTSDNPNTRDRAETELRKTQIRQENRAALERLPQAALLARRTEIGQRAGEVDREFVTAEIALIDERIEAIDEALNSGNPMGAVPGVSLDTPPGQRAAARDQGARILFGLGPDAPVTPEQRAAVPSASREMADEAMSRMRTAIREGRVQDAADAVSRFLLPEVNNPAAMASLAAMAGPEFTGTAVISAVAGPDIGVELFALSQRGAGAPLEFSEAARRLIRDEDLANDISGISSSLTFGSPNASDAAFEMLRDAFIGMFREGQESGRDNDDIIAEFNRLVDPLRDTVEFDNGVTIPRTVAGTTPGEVKAVRQAINRAIGEGSVAVFGENFQLDLGTQGQVVPVFSGDGLVFFASTRRGGALILNADTGQPAFIDPSGVVERARADEARRAAEPPGALAQFVENLTGDPLVEGPGSTFDGVMLRREIPRAAASTGVEPELLETVFSAGRFLQPRERVGRQAQFFFSEDNVGLLDRGAYRAAWRRREAERRQVPLSAIDTDPPDPFRSVTGGAIAAGVLLDELGERFNDPDQALAAYWLGADELDIVIETHGDQWRTGVPMDTLQFILRVKGGMRGRQ